MSAYVGPLNICFQSAFVLDNSAVFCQGLKVEITRSFLAEMEQIGFSL